MGIHGLWDVIESTGRPINIEELAGKIISIDISIWMHQSGKGMKDKHGNSRHNAYLVSIFKRISKLLFYGIKPIMVFDGNVPQLKLQTMAIRREKIKKSLVAQKEIQNTRIEKLLLKHIIDKNDSSHELFAEVCRIRNEIADDKDEIYRHALINEPAIDFIKEKNEEMHIFEANDCENIDWTSPDFNFLPDEIKLELLLDARENSKICPEDELVYYQDQKDNESFSSFQIKKLMHTSSILRELEKVRSNVRAEAQSSFFEKIPNTNFQFENKTITSHILSAQDQYFALIKGFSGNKNINLDYIKSIKEDQLLNKIEDKTELDSRIKAKFFNKINSKAKNKTPINEDDIFINDESKIILSDDDDDEINDDLKNGDSKYKSYDTNLNAIDSNKLNNYNKKINFEHNMSSNCKLKQNVTDNESIDKKTKKGSDLNNEIEYTNIKSPSGTIKQSDLTTNILRPNKLEHLQEEAICLNFNDVIDDSSVNKKFNQPLHNDSKFLEIVEEINSSADESESDFVEVHSINNKEDEADETNKIFINENDFCEAENQSSIKDTLYPINEMNLIGSNLNADSLNKDLIELERMRAKENRNTWTINDQIVEEVQELLQLFGVPYITSPTEAEAQCAFLDHTGQCNGTITEDSDIWAFGGNTVYKNLFSSSKNCCIYRMKDIFEQLGLDRNRIIGLAILCGCDYSLGITGIGPITALEILAYFDDSNLIDNLVKFRNYWQNLEDCKNVLCSDHIKNILKKISIPQDFPNVAVYTAFNEPSVDQSKVQFKWNRPNLDGLRRFTTVNFGWNEKKVDEIIPLVLKKYNRYNKSDQGNKLITDFYSNHSASNSKQSKRLKLAITSLKNNNTNKSNTPKKKKVPTATLR